ncbi:serine-threonine rich [Schistosoma japonicum]|uniref:Serine-threonine rich n=1 Tax=Schistosoma japonicum TaxID=6182 RepID=A0A4Z2D8M7_SCHJA|nr:serine-threonine rich [Schistosoma japonicum]
MSDNNSLNSPTKAYNIAQDYTEQLEPFCSSFQDHTAETDQLHTIFELPISPSQDLFGQPTTSSSYRDSPPIGRTTVNNLSCFWSNCESSSIHQICVNTDSGFSSWTGGSDSKTRPSPNLVPSYCALPRRIISPLASSDRDSGFMLNHTDQDNLPWGQKHLNESDVSSRNLVTNPSSCLSNLPCASELNEELSDRMFIRSMSDMIKHSPTWSSPWTCSNNTYSCEYIPCKSVSQTTADMIGTYSAPNTPSNFSPFLSLGLNSINQGEYDVSNNLQSCGDIDDEIHKTSETSSHSFLSITSSYDNTHERNPYGNLYRPIPFHESKDGDGHLFSSSTSPPSLVNAHSNLRIWACPNKSTDKTHTPISLCQPQQATPSCRSRTVSYTAYLDSSSIKKHGSHVYRPGSAPLQRENLLIREEDSDSNENNEGLEEVVDSSFVYNKRRNKKATSHKSTRRYSQTYQSHSCSHYSTDINKKNAEDANIHENAANLIHCRSIHTTNQQVHPRTNLHNSSLDQCLTNVSSYNYPNTSVRYDEGCSDAHETRYTTLHSGVPPPCSVISLPTSPLNIVTTANESDNNNGLLIFRPTPMPDVVPRLGLHMNMNNNNSMITPNLTSLRQNRHPSMLLQPRCSSVPLVDLNPHYCHRQPLQQHYYYYCRDCCYPLPVSQSFYDVHSTNHLINDVTTATMNGSYTSNSRISLTLLARRLAYIGDELMLDQSRRNQSRHRLITGTLLNHSIRTVNYCTQAFWRFSFSLFSLFFTSPINYVLQSIRLIDQSLLLPLQDHTNTLITTHSSIDPSSQYTYSRQRALMHNEDIGADFRCYALHESSNQVGSNRNSPLDPSFPLIDRSIHQTTRSFQLNSPIYQTSTTTMSSSHTYPYHHESSFSSSNILQYDDNEVNERD